MEKRFQVFVSSTFQDLEEERQEVMHALLELDCIPSGMELFPAANESQWNLIKKVIDDCDYYLLILGGRYGSLGPEGFSYTEMEFRYALSVAKPTIAFIHRDPGKIIAEKTESTPDGKAKLVAFRSEVEKKICKKWGTPEELGSVVSRSLVQLIKSTPAVGWVRANELADRDATLELLRLRRQVEELQTELASARTSAPSGSEGLAQGNEEHLIEYSFSSVSPTSRYGMADTTWTSDMDASWDSIFSSIAPLMIQEASDDDLRGALNKFIAAKRIEAHRVSEALKDHAGLTAFRINDADFQTIKVQLRALGLIAKSVKQRSVKDSGAYWTLTPYGDEIMTRLLAIRRWEDPDEANASNEAAR